MSTETQIFKDDKSETKELIKLMKINYSYPEQTSKDIQYEIYKKREFYGYKIKHRPDLSDYQNLKNYRAAACLGDHALWEHQNMLSNFINPNTPYSGVLIFHGLGTGKTCAAIAIAEKFKEQVAKYGTKIHVLIPGPILKENWRDQLVTCTGNTYMKQEDNNVFMTEQMKFRNKMDAISQAMQYYRLMSYRSFYRKVLGEKIIELDTTTDDKKHKTKYRKTEEGAYERELSVDRIHNLDNSLLIVDEAHNLTGNTYGEAVQTIIKASKNLKVVLLTATPMKNLADDIIYLINLLRPLDSQIERDKVFMQNKTFDMKFREGGVEYLRDMVRGYVSHLRGSDPAQFAKRVDIGIIPKTLLFTKIISCKMEPLQQATYYEAIKDIDDALDRTSEAVSNFVFPGFSKDRTGIIGYHGKEGLSLVRNQLVTNQALLNSKLSAMLGVNSIDLLRVARDNKSIVGEYLDIKYLKNFSIKFYTALKNINKLVYGKKGARTAFIYSNLVKIGIDIFKNILLQNGVLEYDEKVQPLSTTKCSYCGIPYSEHNGKLTRKTKKKGIIEIPDHQYYPTTFLVVTGRSSEDIDESLPEENTAIIKNVFNSVGNIDGKKIKYILGSKVINEGANLYNVGEVHILDVYFNFGRVDQVVGRAIRRCGHMNVMNEKNPYPEVHVYKYAIVLPDGKPSSEESLYSKCEQKHLLVKKVERIIKEEAIDCALNMSGNMFREEIDEFKDCAKDGKQCPATCDYMRCDYKCSNKKLQLELYDEAKHIYRKLKNEEIDHTTFTKDLATTEISNVKKKIKDMYLLNYVYTLESIMKNVKLAYIGGNEDNKDEAQLEKAELFDPYYVYKALDELIPLTENDFNNFKDTIYDKYNRPGYIIFVNNFYIYQPFDQQITSPMHIRTTYDKTISSNVSLRDYLKYSDLNINITVDTKTTDTNGYDFENTQEYYSTRKEFDIVGIIDKEPNKKKIKSFDELEDVFKIREKRKISTGKKRGIGIQTLTGTVCSNSQNKHFLKTLLKKLGLAEQAKTRLDMCIDIKNVLLSLEKYSTDKANNKMTYIIIPANHPTFPFPYNLEDRVHHIIEKINNEIPSGLVITTSTKMSGKYPTHVVTIKLDKSVEKINDIDKILDKYNAIKNKDGWVITIE